MLALPCTKFINAGNVHEKSVWANYSFSRRKNEFIIEMRRLSRASAGHFAAIRGNHSDFRNFFFLHTLYRPDFHQEVVPSE